MKLYLRWLLSQRGVVIALTLLIAALGGLAWKRLPVDAFPDVTHVQVMVLTPAPGLTAEDVERLVSYPIERSLRGLPKVTQVRSLSKSGFSQVVVVFDDNAEAYWTRQVVFERLVEASKDLPSGIEPEIGPLSTGLGEVFQYTLSSDTVPLDELRALQDWLVAPMLSPLSGVDEVNSFGGLVKQYQVLVRQNDLIKYGLSMDEIVDAVESSNQSASGGFQVRDWEQTYLRGVALLETPKQLELTVVARRGEVPVFLRDVADVVIGASPRQGAVTRDGHGEVVAGMVIMRKGENAGDVVRAAKTAIERAAAMLPPGVKLSVFYDRTSLIDACVKTVTDALLEGGLLVIAVLFLFVAELRTAVIVLLALPLSFLCTFVVMYLTGMSANLMSLGGLAFSVGMVVDGAIVVVENVRRHLSERTSQVNERRTIVESAVSEVARPVGFSLLVVALILLPLYALQGIEGKMFEPLASTLLIAMISSLCLALTVVPVLADMILGRGPEKTFRAVKALHRGYLWLVDWALRSPKTTLGLTALVFAASVSLAPSLGTEFLPPLHEGALAINVVRLPNASLEGSVAVSDYLERRLAQYPEIESVISKSGRADIGEDPMGPEQTDIIITLNGNGRTQRELVETLRQDLSTIPGLRFSFSQPIALRVNELVSGVKSDLAIKVFGEDLSLLKETADQAAAVISGIAGVADVKVEQVSGMAQVDVVLDRAALARHGLTVAEVNAVLEIGLGGREATKLVEGDRRTPVVVRLAGAESLEPHEVARLLVPTPRGAHVRMDELAQIRTVEAPAQISREEGRRRVVVEANVQGRDLGGFVAEVKAKLAPLERKLPVGTWVEYGGQFENQERALSTLLLVVPLALALVIALLYLALKSLRGALLVLLNLPFALSGGVIAAVAFQLDLSVSAAVAFIVLIGVAVQNGVVLIAFAQALERQGQPRGDAIRKACALRFRPLLMTALTSFIGHLPMVYATGSGADIQRPLAVVVMGGIVTCTVLTMVVLPILFVGRRRNI